MFVRGWKWGKRLLKVKFVKGLDVTAKGEKVLLC